MILCQSVDELIKGIKDMRAAISNTLLNYRELVEERELDLDRYEYLVARLAQTQLELIKAERLLQQVSDKIHDSR